MKTYLEFLIAVRRKKNDGNNLEMKKFYSNIMCVLSMSLDVCVLGMAESTIIIIIKKKKRMKIVHRDIRSFF